MTFNSETNTIRKTGHNAVIITLLILVILLCIPSVIAAAGSNDAKGGVITNIEIVSYSQTVHWQGYYGLITSGTSPTHFNYFNNSDGNTGTIRKLELGASVQKGDVILITSSSNAPLLSELQRGNISLIDAITGTGDDSGTNTFTNISNYTMPCTGNNITNVPTAYTFVDGKSQNLDFKQGLLKDKSGNTVFVVPVSSAPKQGFDNVSYYFQFMVPNNNTNLKNYYMYYVPSCTAGALQVNIISPENRTYFKNDTVSLNIPITVYANRSISLYNYSLNDGAQQSFVNASTIINPGFGIHKIIAYLKDTNGISGTDTQYFRVSNPRIDSCYPDRYFSISNTSNVAYRINATGNLNKTLYINITAPNGSVSTFNLSNVSDVFYYTPDSEGRHNVTFNANYSECSSYFWSLKNLFPFTIKVLEVNESKGTAGIQARARWYWPGTNDIINPVDYTEDFIGNTSFNYTNSTDYSNLFPDVEFTQYNSSLIVRLNSLNLSTADNEFYHDFVETPPSGFLLTYGIYTTKEFTNANISINYSNTGYSDETKLSLWKCDKWDYLNVTCLSSWVKRTDAEQNVASHLFNITVTNFSGFSIKETVAGGGGGSSGGGGTTPAPTPRVTPAPTPIITTLTPTATPSTVYIPGTDVTLEGKEGNTLLEWTIALLGFMLPASEEEYLEKCEGCYLWGLNYGWWILCWYWWVLLFMVLFLRIVTQTYNMIYVNMFLAFKPDDIKHPVNLAIKIKDSKDSLSSYAREHFSENALELFAEYDGTSPSNAINTTLVGELNRLLQNKTLYGEQRFTHVTVQEDTINLIKQKPRWRIERILLNRLLLDDAYPYEITTCRSMFDKEFSEVFNDIIKSIFWIPVVLILLVPLIGVFGLIISPLNWVIAVLIEIVYLVYLSFNTVPDAKLLLKFRGSKI